MFRVMEYLSDAAGWDVQWHTDEESYQEAQAAREADIAHDDSDGFFIKSIDEDQFMRVLDGLEPPPDDWETDEFGF